MCLRFGVSPGRYAITYRCEVVSKVGVTDAIGPSSVTAETRILAFYSTNLSRRRNEAVPLITRLQRGWTITLKNSLRIKMSCKQIHVTFDYCQKYFPLSKISLVCAYFKLLQILVLKKLKLHGCCREILILKKNTRWFASRKTQKFFGKFNARTKTIRVTRRRTTWHAMSIGTPTNRLSESVRLYVYTYTSRIQILWCFRSRDPRGVDINSWC